MENIRYVNIELYKTFLVVAESNSFADAAEKMDKSPQTISFEISTLESQLNAQLFYRKHKGSNKGLKLTEIGSEILAKVEQMLKYADFIPLYIDSLNSLNGGKLSIGCPSHVTKFYLMEKVAEAIKDNPDLKVHIDTEANSKDLIKLLNNNEIDFIILDTVKEEYRKEFEVKKIKDIPNIFVSKKKIEINDIKELENYKFILSYENKTSTHYLKETLKPYQVELNAICEFPTTEERIEMVKLGIGIAYVMKDAVKKELEREELYEVKLPISLPMNSINLLYAKEQLTKTDKEFIKKYLQL